MTDIIKAPEYSLSALCTKFIEHKKALGCKYDTEARIIGCFLKFSEGFCKTPDISKIYLTRELAEAWVARRPYEQPRTQEPRIVVIRQLALFLRGLGVEAYLLPSRRFPIRSFQPYIFTHAQIEAILHEADQIKPHPTSPYGYKVVPVLLRVLYGTGLRLSEALSLTGGDVNLDNGTLTVHHAKFNKDRLVPMSESLTRVCFAYRESMDPTFGSCVFLKVIFQNRNNIIGAQRKFLMCLDDNSINKKEQKSTAECGMDLLSDNPFFPSRDKGYLSKGGLYDRFRAILFNCGISHGGKGSGPRMHDFRHTFAVHSLGQWVRDGKDIYCMLPTLAAYLGHSNISSTGNYLRLTAEVFPELVEAISKSCGHVIPDCSERFEEDEGSEEI